MHHHHHTNMKLKALPQIIQPSPQWSNSRTDSVGSEPGVPERALLTRLVLCKQHAFGKKINKLKNNTSLFKNSRKSLLIGVWRPLVETYCWHVPGDHGKRARRRGYVSSTTTTPYSLLVESAKERLWTESFTKWLVRPDIRLKVQKLLTYSGLWW